MSKENVVSMIDGTLKSAFTHEEKNEDGTIVKSTHVLTLYADDTLKIDGAPVDKFWEFIDKFYAGKPAKYVPKWVKDKDKVVLKSTYNVPVMTVKDEKRYSFSEYVERGMIRGASVHIKVNVKESALYPVAFQVLEDGEEYDAFADF